MTFYDAFKRPAAAYRGKPFWAWNSALDPDEIRRQVRIFKQMGMGGAFLHSRIGLATEYLGKNWFDAVRAAVDECALEGLEAWLYDEDCWPSGYAGGRVTRNPEYRMRFLVMEIVPAKGFKYVEERDYPVWEVEIEGDAARNLRWMHPGEKPELSHVLLFHEETQACTNYYNGYTYLDTLSEEAVRAFIEETHESYRREVGAGFGNVIPGIFTDEPNFCAFYGDQVPQGRKGIPYSFVPWTPRLLETFEDMFNYSLRSRLPELMLEVEGEQVSKVRLDFRNCVTHLFVTNFMKQIYDWCEEHDLKLAGHVLLEDRLHLQALVVGAAMRSYEYMQTPGIDLLTQYAYDYDTPKQCQSVANQLDRPWMLSELYGCTGWDFSFAGHKALGDWQAALGVNLRCHHLSWYTMKGEAKRDYPASIFFQSPWWEHYRHVEDYYARLHVALTRGRCVQQVLLIHPIESMFARLRPRLFDHDDPVKILPWPAPKDIEACNESIIAVRNMLLENHYDFAYGDEDMMARYGGVVHDKRSVRLRLGACEYPVVVAPPMDTMRRSTLALLTAYRERGGLLLFIGEHACRVDGEPSDAVDMLAMQCPQAPMDGDVVREMLEASARMVSIRDDEGREIPSILYQQRRDNDAHILFLCNTDREKAYDPVSVRILAQGKVVEYDPVTGRRQQVASRKSGPWTVFTTSLPAIGSRLLLIETAPKGRIPKATPMKQARKSTLKSLYALQRTEPNVCVLDRAEYRIGEKGGFRAPDEILRIDRAVRTAMGQPWRGGEMMQPWARVIAPDEPRQLVTLRFRFQAAEMLEGPIWLALEAPRRYVITLNGHEINTDADMGWWVDPAIRKLPLDPAALVVGDNCLECALDFRSDDDLEAMYLLGGFGVAVKGDRATLLNQPECGLGDWRDLMMPFYGAAMVYRYKTRSKPRPGERVIISAADFAGTAIRVLVNGVTAGYLSWPPYELDITDYFERGETDIALELFGSRRNCFGPLHQKESEPQGIGPPNFTTTGGDWSDAWVTRPVGLFANPTLKFMTSVSR